MSTPLRARLKRLSPQRPTGGQTLVAVFVLLALAVGAWMNTLLPTPSDVLDRSFVSSSEAKDLGTINVTEVYGAKKYKDADTNGVWLVVKSTYTPTVEPLSPVGVVEDGQGRLVQAHFDSRCPMTQPGLSTSCTHIFELHPDAVEGATVRFTRTYTEKSASVIVADLGIDAAKKDEIVSSTREVGNEASS